MSHAVVLVVTEKAPTREMLNEIMSPYCEICEEDSKYATVIDRTNEVRDKWKNIDSNEKSEYENIIDFGKAYFGYKYDVEQDMFYNVENPNAKWDWFEVGGRFTDYLNSAVMQPRDNCIYRKSEIDFEKTREAVNEKLSVQYDTIKYAIAQNDMAGLHFMLDVNTMLQHIEDVKNLSKEEYINKYSCLDIPFAIIYNGIWYEKGELGWFGIVHNEDENWDETFMDIWNAISDEYYITIVDYHI